MQKTFYLLRLYKWSVILILAAIFVEGCGRGLRPDYGLIRPWSAELQKKEPHTPPYITEYHYKGKTLMYLAIEQEKVLNKPTFKTIKKVFKENKPTIVLLSGFEGGFGASPKWVVKDLKKCAKKRFKTCGGHDFAAWRAYKSKIDFYSVEPPESYIHEKLTDKGYQSQDMLGFYLTREIIELKKDKQIELSQLPQTSDPFLASLASKVKMQKTFEYEDFLLWSKNFNEQRFIFSKVQEQDVTPSSEKEATALQRLAMEVEKISEHYMLDKIMNTVSSSKVTLLVMDRKYLVKHRKVLEEALNKPIHIKY